VAHISAFVVDDSAKPVHRHKGAAGVAAPLDYPKHYERLRSGHCEQKRVAKRAVAGMVFDRQALGKQVPGVRIYGTDTG
jgi:hypothetical protein